MLPWLPQSSGNGIGSQTPVYCSMLVLSCTLFLTRLYNQAHHINLDSRHDCTSLLGPTLSSSKFSLHSLQQSRHPGWMVRAAAVAIPALSPTIQAAPAIIPDVPLDINFPTSSSSSSSSTSTTTSTSTKKSTKSAHVVSPTHSSFPNRSPSPSPGVPSPKATNSSDLNDPPSVDNSHAPSQARVGAGTPATDASSSHYSPLATVSGLFGDPSSSGTQNDIPPNNNGITNNNSSSTPRYGMSPSTLISASLCSIAAMMALVVGALVVRRRIRNRRRMQEYMDFEGLGAYTANGGGEGKKGQKRQQKTEFHVGLTSFGSIASGTSSMMATTGIKKPAPLAQREQFWNP